MPRSGGNGRSRGPRGKPRGEHCTLYPSQTGTAVVTYIHPGGHELPDAVLPVIVKFFQEHTR